MMSPDHVTDHFLWDEFRCGDGTPVPPELSINVQRLCEELLEPIRSIWGKPVTILSGYRTAYWNRSVGGATKSEHLLGKAADIVVAGVAPLEVYRSIDEAMLAGSVRAGGLGRYERFTHVDIGRPRRWHVQA